MLYYTVMFGGVVIGGLVVYWLCKEAMNIGNNDRRIKRRSAKSNPTDHLDRVVTNTAIDNGPVSWGGSSGLAPKHPARTQAAMPSRSSYWDLPEDGQKSGKLHVYPGGSKSKSEFWNYLVPSDRPGHGTGVKPGGHGTGVKPGGHGTGVKPGGHGTGVKPGRGVVSAKAGRSDTRSRRHA